jgi:glycosyltransferase involved in cell wall biosynthesis
MNKKISVVIPTYRRPELLSRCLLALANQEMAKEDFEVIVVSDGPDHLGQRVVTNLLQRMPAFAVTFYAMAVKKGPAAARNFGWQHANANLVAFTDDDCVPAKTWLKNIWIAFTSIYGRPEKIAFNGRIVVPLSAKPTDYELNTARLEEAEFVTANCVITKNCLHLTGGFDVRFETAWREDSDLHFRLLQQNIPLYKLEDAVVIHPVREAEWGVSVKEQKKSMFNALLYKKFPRLYRKRIQPRPVIEYYVIVISFFVLLVSLLAGSFLLSLAAIWIYLFFTVNFALKRLAGTSNSFSHVAEMIATSFVIPFLSIYWTITGAIRYRVLFL